MIYCTSGDKTTKTRWRTMTQVKRWATRYGHAWEVKGATVFVSCADGTIRIYSWRPPEVASSRPAPAAPAGGTRG